ncbi:MAG: hypothetical protein H7844_11590 [Nitrospirae bacterium YQR-1]
MITPSNRIWLVAFLMFLMLLSNTLFVFVKVSEIENDHRIINYAGMARGTIQRIVKLEMNEEDYEKLATDVDWIIKALLEKDSIHLSDKNKNEYDRSITKLNKSWVELKTLLSNHKNNMPGATVREVVKKSEECWNVANETVFSIQHLLETRVKLVNSVVTFTIINVVYSLVVLFFIRIFIKAR